MVTGVHLAAQQQQQPLPFATQTKALSRRAPPKLVVHWCKCKTASVSRKQRPVHRRWVNAMASYDKVVKVVAPKRIALAEAERAFAAVDAELKGKQVRATTGGCTFAA